MRTVLLPLLLMRQYFLRFGDFQKNAKLFIYLTFILGVSQSVFGLVFNLYLLKLGYTRGFLGTLESIPVFVTAALAVPLALLCVNLPLKKNLLITLGLAAISTLGLAIFPSKVMLISFRLISGFAGAFMAITSWPLMARYSDEKDRDFVFSFQFALSMLAGFLGNLIGGTLTYRASLLLSGGAESAAAYRLTMLCGAALMAAAILPVFYFDEPPGPALSPPGAGPADRPEVRKPPARVRNAWALPDLRGVSLMDAFMVFLPQIIVGFGAGMIMPYLNIFFVRAASGSSPDLGSYRIPTSAAA